ncbi:hypothetical protein EW146_g9717 [Bondarzewia mesenterica]|uniref:Uncharacterized protein n=1 Tax=Bondarzewia mesenterica TaxID=1095465 RepID=A0A4S4L3Y1_9AGAM|nr:hypothetical protein EW146_g9717 [Bondarzewia mesenterica]
MSKAKTSVPSITLVKTLAAHKKGISSLAISLDRACLLSGGDDPVSIIWNLRTGENMQEINCVFHGPVAAITWIDLGAGDRKAFVFGCADGTLHLYWRGDINSHFEFVSLTIAHDDGAVEDIAYDPVHSRIATAGGGTFTSLVLSPPKKKYISKNIHFCDGGSSVIVYYLESHEIVCYSVQPWSLKWSKMLPTRIGNANLGLNGKSLFVTNLLSGVDEYSFPSMERLQMFSHPVLRNFPLQVCNVQDGLEGWVVVGGDDGYARVFSQRTGQLLMTRPHGNDELILIVSAYADGNACLIATGSSNDGPSDIKI